MKEFLLFLFETLKIVFIAVLIVIPIRYFLFQPFIVKGSSMSPNFENGDYLLVDEFSFRLREPKRGEVIVFEPPNQRSSKYIKRIIALPNESIKISNGDVNIINAQGEHILDESFYLFDTIETFGNTEIFLKENEYFVLGDNRDFSSDSRIFGILPEKNIIGRVFFRALPIENFDRIVTPIY